MDELKIIIATNIASLRKNNGMTQAELAEKLCYSDKAISKWERGESIPDVTILKQVADLFSVTVDYLLSWHDGNEAIPATRDAQSKKNRRLITAISSGSVWLIATALFIIFSISGIRINAGNWMVFICAAPVSLTVLLVFTSIWGTKKIRALIVSLLMWSILLCICFAVKTPKIWLILIIGVPAQIIILLSFGIGRRIGK